jgi:putative membrane protein
MTEHVALVAALGPLLALALSHRLSAGYGRPASHNAQKVGRWLPLAFGAHVGALVLWHTPVFFDAADNNPLLHGTEHLSLLATSVVFWWFVVRGTGLVRVLYLFFANVPCTLLGAALVFSPSPWFEHYRSLADQHGAGVVMWVGGGAPYLVAALLVFARSVASFHEPSAATGGSTSSSTRNVHVTG